MSPFLLEINWNGKEWERLPVNSKSQILLEEVVAFIDLKLQGSSRKKKMVLREADFDLKLGFISPAYTCSTTPSPITDKSHSPP